MDGQMGRQRDMDWWIGRQAGGKLLVFAAGSLLQAVQGACSKLRVMQHCSLPVSPCTQCMYMWTYSPTHTPSQPRPHRDHPSSQLTSKGVCHADGADTPSWSAGGSGGSEEGNLVAL